MRRRAVRRRVSAWRRTTVTAACWTCTSRSRCSGADAPVPDGSGRRRRRRRRPRGAQRGRRRHVDLDAPPADAADVYLRLHLLSHRLVRPHGCSLDGLFGVLANVVWTTAGPCAVDGFERVRHAAAGARPGHRARRGQVPADGRLRPADRRADRRRRPGPARRAPRRGHHGDARGLRELQRRHARRVDGRGPDQRRRRRRRRLRHRRRRVDHGDAVRRRQGGRPDRPSAAWSARTPASASRSATTASSRPAAT